MIYYEISNELEHDEFQDIMIQFAYLKERKVADPNDIPETPIYSTLS